MAVFAVVGKLGTGKTKFCVWRAQDALWAGRKVASNVDLHTHILCPRKRTSYVRLPDKPTAFDLEAMGHGNPDSYDEDRNGVLILDELGTWLNSRSFQDKERGPLIDWLIHARKLGWDVYLIVQDAAMIDRQVRDALIEYEARCMRMDKVKVPFVGGILGLLHDRWAYLPRMHMVAARVGTGPSAIVAERWMYRGNDLHAAYDTRQVFTANYAHGAHSVLPPWDFVPQLGLRERLRAWCTRPASLPRIQPKPKHDLVKLCERLPKDEAWKMARYVAGRLDQSRSAPA